MPIQLPYTGVTTTETIPAPFTNGGATVDLTQKEDKANKGVANGYAPLDASAKVPAANLPAFDVSGQITTHNSATTSVHGIANTANLVLTNDSRISGIAGGSITTSNANQIKLGVFGGSITSDGFGGSLDMGGFGGSINTSGFGGNLDLSNHGGSITTGPYGGAINTAGQGSIGLGTLVSAGGTGQTTILGSASGTDRTITLPNATGTVALTSDSRFTDSRTPTAHTHAISQVTNLQATLTAFAIALG